MRSDVDGFLTIIYLYLNIHFYFNIYVKTIILKITLFLFYHLEINNISKDQYYYWQKKLKETRIDTFERQAATFVELPVTKEVPASTELTVTHTICENKNDGCSFKDNTIAAVIKTNGVTFEITNTATSDFIKNLIEAFNHA